MTTNWERRARRRQAVRDIASVVLGVFFTVDLVTGFGANGWFWYSWHVTAAGCLLLSGATGLRDLVRPAGR